MIIMFLIVLSYFHALSKCAHFKLHSLIYPSLSLSLLHRGLIPTYIVRRFDGNTAVRGAEGYIWLDFCRRVFGCETRSCERAVPCETFCLQLSREFH